MTRRLVNVVDGPTTDPDKCAALAEQAYGIYRGMKTDPRAMPHWNDLPREDQGLFTWIARFAHHSSGTR